MKKFTFLFLGLVICITGFSQVPQSINYQGVLTDGAGQPIADQTIGIQISIIKDNPTGTVVYQETHSPQTDHNGRFSIMIGAGTTSDNFSDIQWHTGTYYCKIEIDPAGGTNYTDYGTFQLVSVPFAFYADTAKVALNDNDTDDQNELQDLGQVLTKGNSAGGQSIINLANPTNANDAATKYYVDQTIDNAKVNNRHYIHCVLSLSHQMQLTNSETTIVFDYKSEDNEGLYNTTTGEYFVPETGYYLINMTLNFISDANITNPITVIIRANGGTVTSYNLILPGTGASYHSVNLSYTGKFNNTQKITITISDSETTNPRTLRSAEYEIIRL